ncbi:MAG: hypothetical protein Q8880_00960 [Bacteroidota bacterium]|nr:hypothetical protein [Bacteroidota bacterium]
MNDYNTSNIKFLHLTDSDLCVESRNKSFEQITIKDFNFNISDASKALCVFFVDTRQKKFSWKQLLRLSVTTENRVKQLVL